MTTNLTDEELKRLIQLAQDKPTEQIQPIKVDYAFNLYLDNHKLSSYTIRSIKHTLKAFLQYFDTMPIEPSPIDHFFSNCTSFYTKKQYSLQSLILYKRHLKIIYNYLKTTLKYPNPMPMTIKLINKSQEEHIIWDIQTLEKILRTAEETENFSLILTIFDSGCRVGELGITPEHDCLRTDKVHPELEKIFVKGKSGYHPMHCSKTVCDILMQQSNPNTKAVFWTQEQPYGLHSHSLTERVRRLVISSGITGKKLGAHTFRHTASSIIFDKTESTRAVQQFLNHKKVATTEIYTHEFEDKKRKLLSPLAILGVEINKNKVQNNVAEQYKLILDGTNESSTALTIRNTTPETIEKVEAVPDLSDELFPKIPDDLNPLPRPQLTIKDLRVIREMAVYYTRTHPLDSLPGHLSNRMKQWIKYNRTKY